MRGRSEFDDMPQLIRKKLTGSTSDPTSSDFTPRVYTEVEDWVSKQVIRGIGGIRIIYCEKKSALALGLMLIKAICIMVFGIMVLAFALWVNSAELSFQIAGEDVVPRTNAISTFALLAGVAIVLFGLLYPWRTYYQWKKTRIIISRTDKGGSKLHYLIDIPDGLKFIFGHSMAKEVPINKLHQQSFDQGFIGSVFDAVSFGGDTSVTHDKWVNNLKWIKNGEYFRACLAWVRTND